MAEMQNIQGCKNLYSYAHNSWIFSARFRCINKVVQLLIYVVFPERYDICFLLSVPSILGASVKFYGFHRYH